MDPHYTIKASLFAHMQCIHHSVKKKAPHTTFPAIVKAIKHVPMGRHPPAFYTCNIIPPYLSSTPLSPSFPLSFPRSCLSINPRPLHFPSHFPLHLHHHLHPFSLSLPFLSIHFTPSPLNLHLSLFIFPLPFLFSSSSLACSALSVSLSVCVCVCDASVPSVLWLHCASRRRRDSRCHGSIVMGGGGVSVWGVGWGRVYYSINTLTLRQKGQQP